MKHLQLSLAAAMATIVFLAIGLAALRSPTPLGVSTMFSLAMALLVVSILGAIYGRAFWLGFAVVGGMYMALVRGPWIDERLGSRLVSTSLILRLYNGLDYRPRKQYEDVWWWTGERFDTGYVSAIEGPPQPATYEIRMSDGATRTVHVSRFRPIDPDSYQVLGHSIVCPVLACFGGLVARHFARRKAGPSHTGVGNAKENSRPGAYQNCESPQVARSLG